MHRRRFLSQTLAALSASALALQARAAEAGLQLGFSLYGMKTLPLEQALQTCAEAGYGNVEFALNNGWPTEPKLLDSAARQQVRQQLDAHRLDLSGLMLNLSLAVDDAAHAKNLGLLREAAQFSRDLHPQQPRLIETVVGGKPPEWDALKDKMAARLKDWATVAGETGVPLALKAHIMSAVNSPERLRWLLDQVQSPQLCVAYDFSHFELQGLGLEKTWQALQPQTRFIHVKDSQGEAAKFRFVLPGEGRTDYAKYFRLLKASGYRGPVVVEVSGQVFNQPGYDPIAAAKKCFATLDAALRA